MPGAVLTSMIFKIPIIYDCRDEEFPEYIVRFGTNPVWFSCAENITRRLHKFGVNKNKIVRIPVVNPPYISEISTKNDSGSEFSIIFVGSIRKHKGVFELINGYAAFAKNKNNVELKVVGDGSELNQLKKKTCELAVEEKTRFLGQLTHRQTLKEISKADILILPSKSEGLPRVIIEAIELETIVITTSVGDIEKVINDKETGIIIQRNKENITNSLLKIYNDDELRSKVKNNLENFELDVDWDKLVDKIEKNY
jgi:glycosyltransferase involved in cell wall biosynthesis